MPTPARSVSQFSKGQILMYSNMNRSTKSQNISRLDAFLVRNAAQGGSATLDSGNNKARRSPKAAKGRAVGFPDGRAVFFKA